MLPRSTLPCFGREYFVQTLNRPLERDYSISFMVSFKIVDRTYMRRMTVLIQKEVVK